MKDPKRLNEGDWFAVPLDEGGFGVGLVARLNVNGVLFGYFFGPTRAHVPDGTDLRSLTASDAVLVTKFGHLGLRQKRWPLIGAIDDWDRSEWPMAALGRIEAISGRAFAVEYSDVDPNKVVGEHTISVNELAALPKDGLLGAQAVEGALTRILAKPS